MELANVERALKRPGEYFLEDGLFEIAMGLWLGLTVALPQWLGGPAGNWAPVVMALTSLGLRPAVLAAKSRWVYPRSGRVTYPEDLPAGACSSLPRTEAGPRAPVGPVAPRRAVGWSTYLLGTAAAILMGVSFGLSRRLGFGDAGGHMTVGLTLGILLLAAAWRWQQHRWIALAVTFPLLGALVASSGLDREGALTLHAGGLAAAVVVSGTSAFVAYLRQTPKAWSETDGR